MYIELIIHVYFKVQFTPKSNQVMSHRVQRPCHYLNDGMSGSWVIVLRWKGRHGSGHSGHSGHSGSSGSGLCMRPKCLPTFVEVRYNKWLFPKIVFFYILETNSHRLSETDLFVALTMHRRTYPWTSIIQQLSNTYFCARIPTNQQIQQIHQAPNWNAQFLMPMTKPWFITMWLLTG